MHDITVIAIDYFKLMTEGGENRQGNELSSLS